MCYLFIYVNMKIALKVTAGATLGLCARHETSRRAHVIHLYYLKYGTSCSPSRELELRRRSYAMGTMYQNTILPNACLCVKTRTA